MFNYYFQYLLVNQQNIDNFGKLVIKSFIKKKKASVDMYFYISQSKIMTHKLNEFLDDSVRKIIRVNPVRLSRRGGTVTVSGLFTHTHQKWPLDLLFKFIQDLFWFF